MSIQEILSKAEEIRQCLIARGNFSAVLDWFPEWVPFKEKKEVTLSVADGVIVVINGTNYIENCNFCQRCDYRPPTPQQHIYELYYCENWRITAEGFTFFLESWCAHGEWGYKKKMELNRGKNPDSYPEEVSGEVARRLEIFHRRLQKHELSGTVSGVVL